MQTLTSRCGRIKTPVENLRALFTYNSLDGSMVRSDNRIANLRLATRSQNAMNQKINRLNKSGFAGVRWDAGTRKWVASIGHEGRRIFLGNFDSKVDAVRIRLDAEIRLHGEYRPTNGGR